MAVTQAIPLTRHPYADGGLKKMLIGGKWVEAASGKTFETLNPATGELLAPVAEGEAEDINRAVAAARRAFEGPWSKVKPFERQALLLKLADLVDKNFDELAQLDTLDMGAPLSRTRGNKPRVVGMLRYYAGKATVIHGETIENSLPGEIFSYTLKEPVGVVGAIIPWNGPLGAASGRSARAGDRLHGGAEAGRGSAADLAPPRRAVHGGRHSAGRRQHRHRLRRDRGRGAGIASRCRQGRLHRFPRHRPVDRARLGRQPEARVAGAWRQVAGHRLRRRRPRGRRAGRGHGGLRQLRPDLQRRHPPLRRAARSTTNSSAASPTSARSCGSATASIRTRRSARWSRTSSSSASPATSTSATRRARRRSPAAAADRGRLAKGYFVPPTVFANVNDNMRIAQEEIFGPVISAIPFNDIDELIQRANATIFGLGSGVWTRDVSKAHRLAKAIRAGSVWVNCYQAMDPAVPFGGYKMSGYGRESGRSTSRSIST